MKYVTPWVCALLLLSGCAETRPEPPQAISAEADSAQREESQPLPSAVFAYGGERFDLAEEDYISGLAFPAVSTQSPAISPHSTADSRRRGPGCANGDL